MLELLGFGAVSSTIIILIITIVIALAPISIWYYTTKINARLEELNKGQDIEIQLLEELIELMKKG